MDVGNQTNWALRRENCYPDEKTWGSDDEGWRKKEVRVSGGEREIEERQAGVILATKAAASAE